MNSATDLARMVPGFDFLQGLLKNASAGLPSMGQWIAPTLDPAELEKRIQELKTVHFWLEQNARLLATTIQAMEVQRMTLATLHGMNVPLADLTEALKIKLPDSLMPRATAAEPEAETGDPDEPEAAPSSGTPAGRSATAGGAAAPAVVDPLQWWGALTQQFTELAAQAVKDGPADAARSLADAMVKGTMDTASTALKMATGAPAGGASSSRAQSARKTPGQSSGKTTGKTTGKSAAPGVTKTSARKTAARKAAATPAARAHKR